MEEIKDLTSAKSCLKEWKGLKVWRGSFDYPFQWIGIQLEALMAAWEVLAALKGGGELKSPEELSRQWAEWDKELDGIANLPVVQRHFSHRVAVAQARWSLEMMKLALELAKEKPKKLSKLHICPECGWQALSKGELAKHAEKHHLDALRGEPQRQPEPMPEDQKSLEEQLEERRRKLIAEAEAIGGKLVDSRRLEDVECELLSAREKVDMLECEVMQRVEAYSAFVSESRGARGTEKAEDLRAEWLRSQRALRQARQRIRALEAAVGALRAHNHTGLGEGEPHNQRRDEFVRKEG